MNLERRDHEILLRVNPWIDRWQVSYFLVLASEQLEAANLSDTEMNVLRIAWAKDFISWVSGSIFEKPRT
jgi:hypothetical protein